MNFIKKLWNGLKALVAPAAAAVTMAVGSAHAALPVATTTAITDAGADLLTAIGAVITAMVAVWGLKKLGSKMGWL
jgi:hypothetical protein